MGYELGIDLGTTWTAAAVHRDGRVDIVGLGNRHAVIPSVLFLRDDEEVLTGESAQRRAVTEPDRVAREFKRRVGDPTPILVGSTPYSTEALSAKLLRWVVDRVAEREGGAPDHIVVTHPANWGTYKQDLLTQAIRLADIGSNATTLSEPEAAAISYASQERIETGSIVAVFDLGGGTFDAAILRKKDIGFEILGQPEGIERLGGIDFDEAVFQHVLRSLGGVVDQLDADDPNVTSAVARLRQECVDAKEALSADTEVSIPVVLPNVSTDIRLTRSEFESMIRPSLADTLGAMQRAIRSAGLEVAQIDSVLLVGGSSRIPLVAQLVGAELGRPVAVDAHPKHAIALGAALAAASATSGGDVVAAAPSAPEPVAPPVVVPTSEPVAPPPVAKPAPAPVAAPAPPPQPVAAAPTPQPVAAPPKARPPKPASDGGNGRNIKLVLAGVFLVVAAGLGFAAFAGGSGNEDAATTTQPPVAETTAPAVVDTTTPIETTTTLAETTTTAIETTTTEELCVGKCVEIKSVSIDGDSYVVVWGVNFSNVSTGGEHAHFYFSPSFSSDQVTAGGTGLWEITDDFPYVSSGNLAVSATPQDAKDICATAADGGHNVIDPLIFDCFEIPFS